MQKGDELPHAVLATRATLAVLGFLFGIPIGSLVTTAILGALPRAQEHPRVLRFGDITISAFTPKTGNSRVAEELLIKRNGRSFFWAAEAADGETMDMCLVNGPERIVLTAKALAGCGTWGAVSYGWINGGIRMGEHYQDMNFDGQFDAMSAHDGAGQVRFSRIYMQEEWKQVDRLEGRRAFLGKGVFVFDSSGGWQLAN